MKKLPPIWYSKAEKFLLNNRVWFYIGLYFLVFVLPIFFGGSEPLDDQLLIGIGD